MTRFACLAALSMFLSLPTAAYANHHGKARHLLSKLVHRERRAAHSSSAPQQSTVTRSVTRQSGPATPKKKS